MLIIGAQQSGKSTLADLLSRGWSRGLWYDPKAEPWLVPEGALIARSGAAAVAAMPGRVMYHPPVLEKRKAVDDFDVAVRRVIALRGHAVVIHELKTLCDTKLIGGALDQCLYQGPAMGIPMMYCTQEPVRIHTSFFSQANTVIVFYLSRPHREYLASQMGVDALREPIPLDHSYAVWTRARPEELVRRPAIKLARAA